MPRGADKMGLSNMNFAGMGLKMIKHVIKKHNALTLPQLIEMASSRCEANCMYDYNGLIRITARRIIRWNRICGCCSLFSRRRRWQRKLVHLIPQKSDSSKRKVVYSICWIH